MIDQKFQWGSTMSMLRSWLGRISATRRTLFRLESLEERAVPAIVTVSNNLDVDNGDTTSIAALVAANGGDGISLREALIAANKTDGLDEIRFDIADGEQIIPLGQGGVMPEIYDPLIINGAHRPPGKFSQRIVLDGSALPVQGSDGIILAGGSDHSRVWGLGFTGFRGSAVLMYDVVDIHVGGAGVRDGNRFFENATCIRIGADDPNGDTVLPAHGVYVVGNLIGAPSWNFDFSNFCERSFIGIKVYGSSDVYIGGAAESERNVIVNNQTGIDLVGASWTTVYNNYIGTLDGYTPLGNSIGISISHLDHDGPAGPILSSDVTIGGDAVVADGVIQEAANVIAGNSTFGIQIDGLVNHVSRPMPRTRVSGNYIGVGDDGYTPMPNGTGVYINELHTFRLSDRLTIGSRTNRPEERNVISGNEGDGVYIVNSSLCLIRYNIIGRGADQEEIAANGGWGINDEAEVDSPAWDSHNIHRDNDADCNMGGNIRIHRPADVEENHVFDGGGVGISVEAPGVLVRNNNVRRNIDDGIRVDVGDLDGAPLDITIAENTVSQNGGSGLALVGDSMLAADDPAAGAVVHDNDFFANVLDGVTVTLGGGHQFADNLVHGNGRNGFRLDGDTRYNRIAGGSVYDNEEAGLATTASPGVGNTSLGTTYVNNGGLGIDRGDDGVTAAGAPRLTAKMEAGSWLVSGILDGEPGDQYVVEFFDNAAVDPSYYGEGEVFLGSATITIPADGRAKFAGPAPVFGSLSGFPNVRATATRLAPDAWTSEFSKIEPPPTVRGRVFDDGWTYTNAPGGSDRDGIQNGYGAYAGYSGLTVLLLDADGTVVDTTTTTDSSGSYLFTLRWPGSYRVKFTLPTTPDPYMSYWFSPQDQGGDDTIDSDADPATGLTALFDIDLGETTHEDAGVIWGYFYHLPPPPPPPPPISPPPYSPPPSPPPPPPMSPPPP